MEYAIVDIETTGSFAEGNNITEIAIIIHNGKYSIDRFQSLVKPDMAIPFHIQTLTGISDEMVSDAPRFEEIADKVFELLNKRVFVAHNASFDYSFLVKELKQSGYTLKSPKLCTVRLARKIIPNLASYSLGKLCHNLGIPIKNRHRAMGDTEATVILFDKLLQNDKEGVIESALRKTKEQRLPTQISEDTFLQLPETPGIYIFRNQSSKIIYVGKAINIRKRVLTHFTGNSSTLRRQNFINEICHIDFEESGTELMALLMECQMIKQHWPTYNSALKKYEPKFGLVQYEDQNGYIRLFVSKFNQSTSAVQHFERASDANALLLKLIEDFELDNRLCSFFSTQTKLKASTLSNLPDKETHNEGMRNAISQIKEKQRSFILFDQGRNIDEKSYIFFKDNLLQAFGFVDVNHQFEHIEDIISKTERCVSNYYMNSLVLQYAERYPTKVNVLTNQSLSANYVHIDGHLL